MATDRRRPARRTPSPTAAFKPAGFASSLISCPNVANSVCGFGYVVTVNPEPLTSGKADVKVFGPAPKTFLLSVEVKGAAQNVIYEVHMLTQSAAPFDSIVGLLATDGAGDGDVDIPLPPDTYISGVILFRDSNGDTIPDPRIFTGFVVQ